MSRNATEQGKSTIAARPRALDDARRRAAVEIFARHEETLRRTARRYSLCADDVDEALQRALEIVLTKAPTDNPRELIRWTQTVIKHEALAVRQGRERILSPQSRRDGPGDDWVATIPATTAGPAEQVERRETIARSREALKALKPQELRALTLLAEGYSYVEIEQITGFSQTKINRCLAEGRERYRNLLLDSEEGSRCADLRPLLSAFCDGKVEGQEAEMLREHLRACGGCRATLRAYRGAPHAAAALAPALPVGRSLLDRLQEMLGGLAARLPGQGGGDATASQIAVAGGTRGAGAAALAKLLAVCAGTAGTAACVATGIVPAPIEWAQRQAEAPRIEPGGLDRTAMTMAEGSGVEYEPASPTEPAPAPDPESKAPAESAPEPVASAEPAAATGPEASAGAVEYEPVATPAPAPSPAASATAASTAAAGEFGP